MADKGNYQSEHPPIENAPPVRYTLKPGEASQIVLKTLPGAVCTFHREDESDPTKSLRLYADQEGMLRFYAHPAVGPESIAKVILDCEVGEKTRRYPLELRLNAQPTPQMPAPTQTSPKSHLKGASVRPALSEEDARHLPDEELAKRGYPPRPDPVAAPGAFEVWRRAVSTPTTIVEPEIVSRPDISHGLARFVQGPETLIAPTATTFLKKSYNWDGYELLGTGPYAWVSGDWRVPSVSGEAGVSTYSAFWVGLDGDTTLDGVKDLVQAGTVHNNWYVLPPLSFSSYYAMTELFPQQPTNQQITNFPINPGDEIFVQVYIANAGGIPDLAGSFAQFWLENMTTRNSVHVYTPKGSTTVSGRDAAWIMERPFSNGQLTDLADYGSVTMSGAWARLSNSPPNQGYVTYRGDTNNQITMVNGGGSLSTVIPINDNAMLFTWQAFH